VALDKADRDGVTRNDADALETRRTRRPECMTVTDCHLEDGV